MESGGRPVPHAAWHRRSAKTLVKLLATVPGHTLHREQVIDLLWPEVDLDSGTNSLAKALHGARHAIEPGLPQGAPSRHLIRHDELLSLEQVWIDADHFEVLAQEALMHGSTPAIFEQAIALYGELLPEDLYEDWITARRESLTLLYHRLLLALATLLERRGADEPALERLREAVRVDPLQEEAHRALMRLYARNNRRQEAFGQYQRCRALLQQELAVEPEPETEALYQAIRTGTLDRPATLTSSRLPPALTREPAVAMIGRERTLEVLLETLDRSERGSGGAVLVGGEAGVGKTRLVAEVARAAHRRGVLVLWGAGYDQEGLLPYGLLVEALDGCLAGHSVDERRTLATRYPVLARLLPTLLAEITTSQQEPSAWGDRGRLFADILHLLDDLTASRPLLVVLDDLHPADGDSLQVVHYLTRLAPERRWLLLGTYREEGVAPGSAFQELLAGGTRQHSLQRLDLLRLARNDCDHLVQGMLPGGRVDLHLLAHIYALSRGHPLFLQELVRAKQEGGDLQLVDGCWQAVAGDTDQVPASIRELVAVRVDRMGEEVGRLLSLAALAGMECSLALLHGASSSWMPEEAFLAALDRALAGRILEERGTGYVFGHPLLRAALAERLPAHRRIQLHARLAATLEEQPPDDVESLAYHYRQAGNLAKAIDYLEQAGDRAEATYAHGTAEGYYRELLRLADEMGDQEHRVLALEKLGGVLSTTGRHDEALEVLETAVAERRALHDFEAESRVVAEIALIHVRQGRLEAGIPRIHAMLEVLDERESPAAIATLHIALTRILSTPGRYADQLPTAARAVELSRLTQDDRLLVAAQVSYGLSLFHVGEVESARDVLESTIPLAEATGDLASLYQLLYSLAYCYLLAGDFDASMTQRNRALELAKQTGDPLMIGYATALVGQPLFQRGDWRAARTHFETAAAALRPFGSCPLSAYPTLGLGLLDQQEGRREAASSNLQAAISVAERSGDLQVLRYAHLAIADDEIRLGRPDGALSRLQPFLDRPGLEEPDVTMLLPHLAWAQLEGSNRVLAEETLAQALRRARGQNNRVALAHALPLLARLLNMKGQRDEAERAMREALRLTRAMPYPHYEARSLQAWGTIRAEYDGPTRTRERWTAALTIFQRLRAREDAVRTIQSLAALPEC